MDTTNMACGIMALHQAYPNPPPENKCIPHIREPTTPTCLFPILTGLIFNVASTKSQSIGPSIRPLDFGTEDSLLVDTSYPTYAWPSMTCEESYRPG
jgi:hypothetical protein